jgi:hypothetical protein
MTLIISVITHGGVLQASDRRLVWLQADGSTRLRDDDRNKAVLYGSRIVFAYTGLAELGPKRQPTDDWLAQALSENHAEGDQADILKAVTVAATARLKHPLYRKLPPAMRGHEFAACGWARFPSTQMKEFRPYIAFVTNLRDADGQLRSMPGDECQFVWGELTPDQPGAVWVSGQQLATEQHAQLLNDIAAAAPDLQAMGIVLIAHIRNAAADNDAIGRGVLLNCLPRGAVREGDLSTMLIAGGPMEDTPTFFYVPANESELRQYGPIIVSPSGGIMSGFVAGPPESFDIPEPTG